MNNLYYLGKPIKNEEIFILLIIFLCLFVFFKNYSFGDENQLSNFLKILDSTANIIIGLAAIVSLFFSLRAFKKSEWDSAMNTSPSLILRPKEIYVGVRDKEIYCGYGVCDSGDIINENQDPFEIVFVINFECFNAGRGTAFNISQPQVIGMKNLSFYKIPHYQTVNDDTFSVELKISKKFKEWKELTGKIPVSLSLKYTNDQNNVYCKSKWTANIKPFKLENGNLVVRKIKILNRRSQITYLPYKNND